jgi:hypothetical protein
LTNAIQISTRRGDDILVIGGENPATFIDNLNEVLGPEMASQLAGEFPDFFNGPAFDSPAGLSAVKQVFPDAAVMFDFRGRQEGDWVTDKWGNKWNLIQFDEAPNCQCGNRNLGKLALKKGRSQAGKDYTMWACANTYEGKAGDGCPSIFNDRGKAYPA